MPQTIKPMGLIHLPGTGPNNRFDFKNKGNNRANEARGSCWHGYQQKGYKKKGNKMVPNCVPKGSVKKEEVDLDEQQNNIKRVSPGSPFKPVKGTNPVTGKSQITGFKDPVTGSMKSRFGNAMEEYVEEGEAWTKKEGQNKEGGLNEKGRKSYERANPGSDLKAPSKKKAEIQDRQEEERRGRVGWRFGLRWFQLQLELQFQ